ncbi:MAG: hypothetical protein ACOYJ6_18155, partial [Caulobacterales bacterium]
TRRLNPDRLSTKTGQDQFAHHAIGRGRSEAVVDAGNFSGREWPETAMRFRLGQLASTSL